MQRLQVTLIFGAAFVAGGLVTLLVFGSTPNPTIAAQTLNIAEEEVVFEADSESQKQGETATPRYDELPLCRTEAPEVETFHEQVQPHVAVAISKLYKQLKANGSIINDLLTTSDPIIPNIYHYVRFNQSFVKFYEMLSMKSALKVGQAQMVYIHTNQAPEGRFWDMIKDSNRIKVVHRDPPTSIYGKEFGWVQHASDLARIQILREYGGIYMDNDCVVLQEFERVRKHHCVVSKSSHERHMGNMLMMATKDCVFMRMYEELYKLDYQRDRWYYNGGELPQYALLDQYPGIAYMADEGVQQGMMYWLWALDNHVVEFQKKWNIIHLFYGHKDYTYKDTTDYDEMNIRTKKNSFSRIARWIMYDHEEPFEE